MNRYFTFTGDKGKKKYRRVIVFFDGADSGRSYWRSRQHGQGLTKGFPWSMEEMADEAVDYRNRRVRNLFTEVSEQRAKFILGQIPTKP